MKNLLLAIVLTSTFIVTKMSAQENTPLKVKEYGIGLSNLNSFSLQYRWGNEKRLYRINATLGGRGAFGSGSNSSVNNQDSLHIYNNSGTTSTKTPLNLNFGLGFSVFKLKTLSEKFGIIYGGVVGLSYSYNNIQNKEKLNSFNGSSTAYSNSNTKTITQALQPYAGIVLGTYYKINSSFLVYLDIAPNIYYSFNQTKISNTITNSPQNTSLTSDNSSSLNIFGLSNLSNSGAALTIVYRITK